MRIPSIFLIFVQLLCCAVTFSCCAVLGSCRREGLSPGVHAPDIELASLQGGRLSLANFHGKLVLLNFWATTCAPCLEELPALERMYKQLASRGVVVFGVAVGDSVEDVSRVVQKFGVTFPIVLDPEGQSASRYKVQGYPESFIVDASGKLVLFPDTAANNLVLRIVGARSWDSEQVTQTLLALK